jgi:hypothetical protein
MSYTEYLRRKAAGSTVVLNTQKPTDASMFIMKKRQEASSIFRPDGTQVGSMVSGKDRSGNDHQPLSYVKQTGRPQSASDYTAYRGSQGIRDDAAYKRGRIEQSPAVNNQDIPYIPFDIASNGSRFIEVGGYFGFSADTIRYSDDNGITWTPASTGFSTGGMGIYADPLNSNNWVAVGNYNTPTDTSIKYSTDNGLTWSSVTSNYFTSVGNDVTADSAGNWILVGSNGLGGGNTIKIFSSFANLTTGTVQYDGVVDMFTSSGNGVATDGTTTIAVGIGGTTIMSALNADLSTWTRVTTGDFSSNGNRVATDGSGNWVLVGYDSVDTIKTMVSSDLTTANNIAGNQFVAGGLNAAYDASQSRWVLVGFGANNDSIKTASSFSNLVNGIFDSVTGEFSIIYPLIVPYPVGTSVTSDGSGNWVAGGVDPVIKRSNNGRNWTPESVSFVGCSCVPVLKPAPKSASDIMRDRLARIQSCGQPHNANELGPALFVDNTIRLKHLIGCCDNDITKANHEHPVTTPYASWSPRPDKGAGGIPVYTVSSPSDARKVGDFNPRKVPYVEKHHGNDLNVNPRRVPGPFKLNTGIPHLKINDPIQSI